MPTFERQSDLPVLPSLAEEPASPGRADLNLERRVEERTAGLQAALDERMRIEAKLRASEERYRRIFQTTAISIWDEDFSDLKAALDELRAQGVSDLRRYLDENPGFLARAIQLIRISNVNDATLRLFEATDKAELLGSLERIFVPDTLNVFRHELLAVFEGRPRVEGEAPLRTLKGRSLRVAFSMSADPRDSELRSVLVSLTDITECRQAEEKAKLLAREVNHRANNLLTVMSAMMRQTRAETVPEFISSMQGRINALARVQTRLARDQWDRTDLRKLIGEELAPFANDISRRFRIAGPDVPLGPDAAQALAITIHELAMNAVKYGSLSNPVGRVAIEWAISGEQLTLSWTETGGPATYRPNREGFGTRAISVLAQQLGGSVSVDWRRAGLVCTLAIPVQSVKA
jgi:two-component sensor histidine kinase